MIIIVTAKRKKKKKLSSGLLISRPGVYPKELDWKKCIY